MENVLMFLTVLFQLNLVKIVFLVINLKETLFVKTQSLHVKKLERLMDFANSVIQDILSKDLNVLKTLSFSNIVTLQLKQQLVLFVKEDFLFMLDNVDYLAKSKV